jgi:hypothetical protein
MQMMVGQPQRSFKGIALGAFVLFQLIYLPTANCIKLVALRLAESNGELDDDIQLRGQQFPERVQALADTLGTAFVRYGELTGQAQGWSLFAPMFGHQASLPMVAVGAAHALHFDRPEVIRSEFAPQDPNWYVHLPNSRCRLFNYEYRLALLYWTWDAEAAWNRRDEWSRVSRERVRRQNHSMLAYMKWRTNQYLAANPRRATPSHVYLLAEIVPNPPIEKSAAMRQVSRQFTLALWQPFLPTPSGMFPLQAIDLFSSEPTWLPIEGPP